MGCGSSSAVDIQEATKNEKQVKVIKITPNEKAGLSNKKLEPIKNGGKTPAYDAFEIPLHNEDQKTLNHNIDSILAKQPQAVRRSQLEPLNHSPKMANNQMDLSIEKQQRKKERRLRQLTSARRARTAAASRPQTSAAEVPPANTGSTPRPGVVGDTHTTSSGFEFFIPGTADMDPATLAEMLNDKMATAEKAREAKLLAIQEKQRLREEKAIRIRERALMMKQQQHLDGGAEHLLTQTTQNVMGKGDMSIKTTAPTPASSSGYNSRRLSATSS